jgi:hypothetical protein
MILKIRTCMKGNNENENEVIPLEITSCLPEESWRFFDGVQGLHYTIYPQKTSFMKIEAAKWKTPKGVQEIWMINEYLKEKRVLFASFDNERTGPTHLFCNSECYLLNDQGKTIERLI